MLQVPKDMKIIFEHDITSRVLIGGFTNARQRLHRRGFNKLLLFILL